MSDLRSKNSSTLKNKKKKDKGEHFVITVDDRKKKVYPDSPRTKSACY